MKKSLLTLITVILSITVNGQDKMVFSSEFEGGFATKRIQYYYAQFEDDAPDMDNIGFYSDLKFGVHYKAFSLMTSTQTYFVPNFMSKRKTSKKWESAPYLCLYDISLSYRLNRFVFGAEHRCGHIIQSSSVEKSARIHLGHNKIYVKFKIK